MFTTARTTNDMSSSRTSAPFTLFSRLEGPPNAGFSGSVFSEDMQLFEGWLVQVGRSILALQLYQTISWGRELKQLLRSLQTIARECGFSCIIRSSLGFQGKRRSDSSFAHRITYERSFFRSSILIAFWPTHWVSSENTLRCWFPRLFRNAAYCLVGQTYRHTNIFCLQDPFY